MKARRKQLAFELALAGIGTALALICNVLYYYIPLAKLSLLALAGVALMLSLTAGHVRGAALAYVAASGLTIAIIGPIPALPFVFLFGWQPVVMGICRRYMPKRWYIALPLKAILFNAGLYGTYALFGLGDTLTRLFRRLDIAPAYWIVAIAGTALWLGYDYIMQWVLRWLDTRLAKVTAKYKVQPTTKGSESTTDAPDASGEDIFGEYADGDATDDRQPPCDNAKTDADKPTDE